ncbi:tRNA 2-selenouridine synthase [Monaibacterium marinum]|uniref:tRNA 2-selenouridine synthase n=1 Tax=Pontivivens marinum TaxID=1690039 RepID=A0A2C9CMX0_9RHOB|nr:tRNA 2-selenouridine(34) synthase MnmH [Monaibacterium marinum]SOH92557.1 tRNA 2-selenouridine synthase [Monaibacterium marinum]
MTFPITSIADLKAAGFDDIIDVRSPSEFAEDHLPGAINLPVLSDEQRAVVGTIYVQTSRLEARKLGAALVSRNVADHIDAYFADKPGSYRPLVYCWRGGQRSGSMGLILKQIGWRAEVLEGGYRTYRRLVSKTLYEDTFPWKLVLLDGNTGCAKTDILKSMDDPHVQVVDLEGLARHRGSVFGGFVDAPQPSQKAFETALMDAFSALDPSRPVMVEAESSKIGQLLVPPTLWKAMQGAPRIQLSAPLDERADYLTRAYSDIVADPTRLDGIIDRLQGLHSYEVLQNWRQLAASGALRGLAAALMQDHYDAAYSRQRARSDVQVHELSVERLDDAGIAETVRDVAAIATRITAT